MLMPPFRKILVTSAICLGAGVLSADSAAVATRHDDWQLPARIDCDLDCKELYTDLVQQYNELLKLARGIHDKASADAAAEIWRDLEVHATVLAIVALGTTEDEMDVELAEVSATYGAPHILEKELEAEKERLRKAYYFNSEELAFVLAGDSMAAYPCAPATPEVAQLFSAAFKNRLLACVGESNLSGGPGYSPETAWVITSTPENEKAVEAHITRLKKLNYAAGMREMQGLRFNMLSSGRQRMVDGTYLFHIYRVVPNGSCTAYQLKQYFRIKQTRAVKSESEILTIAAREFGHDMKGYTARYEDPYYHVELTEFEDPTTLGGGPALKIDAYTGEIVARYFTE